MRAIVFVSLLCSKLSPVGDNLFTFDWKKFTPGGVSFSHLKEINSPVKSIGINPARIPDFLLERASSHGIDVNINKLLMLGGQTQKVDLEVLQRILTTC